MQYTSTHTNQREAKIKLGEIKAEVLNGETVHWKSPAYKVVEHFGQFSIKCVINNHMIGLTHVGGVTNEH